MAVEHVWSGSWSVASSWQSSRFRRPLAYRCAQRVLCRLLGPWRWSMPGVVFVWCSCDVLAVHVFPRAWRRVSTAVAPRSRLRGCAHDYGGRGAVAFAPCPLLLSWVLLASALDTRIGDAGICIQKPARKKTRKVRVCASLHEFTVTSTGLVGPDWPIRAAQAVMHPGISARPSHCQSRYRHHSPPRSPRGDQSRRSPVSAHSPAPPGDGRLPAPTPR